METELRAQVQARSEVERGARELAAARADHKALALLKDEALERLSAASKEAAGQSLETEALRRELAECRGALDEATREGDMLRAENHSMKEQLLNATRYAQALEQTLNSVMGHQQAHQQYQLQQHQQAQHRQAQQHQQVQQAQAWGAVQTGAAAAEAAAKAMGQGGAWGAAFAQAQAYAGQAATGEAAVGTVAAQQQPQQQLQPAAPRGGAFDPARGGVPGGAPGGEASGLPAPAGAEEADAPLGPNADIPLLDEGMLVGVLSKVVPVGRSAATVLSAADQARLDRAFLVPHQWASHYAARYGGLEDFLRRHPERFAVRPDGAVYQLEPPPAPAGEVAGGGRA